MSRSYISLVGNTTTGQNVGTGAKVYRGKNNGNNLQFKTISTSGNSIQIIETADQIFINYTGGTGGTTYSFVASGATVIGTNGSTITIYAPSGSTGNTFQASGGTIINRIGDLIIIYSPTGGTTGGTGASYNFIGSGATIVTEVGNNVTIYSPTSVTGNTYVASGGTIINKTGDIITIYSPPPTSLAGYWTSGQTVNYVTGYTSGFTTGNTFIQSGGTIISQNGDIVTIYTPTGTSLVGYWTSGETVNYVTGYTSGFTTGNTFIQSGGTVISQNGDIVTIYTPTGTSLAGYWTSAQTVNYVTGYTSGFTTGNTFIQSGGTIIIQNGDIVTIYTQPASAITSNYVTIPTFSAYTGTTLIDIQDRLLISTFTGFTGTTLPANYYNKLQVDGLISGFTTGNTFIQSGGTIISQNGDVVTIYSQPASAITSNYVTIPVFSAYTGTTLIDIQDRLLISTFSGYTGTTAQDIADRLLISTFTGFTGTTLPANYYNKLQVDGLISGFTTGNTFIQSGGTIISQVGDVVTIYSQPASAITSNYVTIPVFSAYTGTTLIEIQDRLLISTFTGYTATTGLQQVTEINAATNIESTFSGGLVTGDIRPIGDSVTAVQINNATGGTIINVDTVSGLTGFGTIVPKGLVHVFGSNPTADAQDTQTNAVIVDGILSVDKDVIWSENGVPKWLAETYRDENSVFWYLYNPESENAPLTIMETGRIGINKQSNFMNYHSSQIVGNGLNDLVLSGAYTKNYNTVYEVEIVATTGVSDTYHWRKSLDNGIVFGSYSPDSGCTLTPTLLEHGIYINFENLTGHTIGNIFQFAGYTQIPQGTFTIAPMGLTEVEKTLDYTVVPVSGITYNDITGQANGGFSGNQFEIFGIGASATTQALYWGTTVPIHSLYFNLNVFGTNIVLITEYWNGTSWIVLNTVTHNYVDETSNLTKSGRIIWSPDTMTGWNRQFLEGKTEAGYDLYWLRIRTSTNPGIAPIANSLSIGNDKRFSVYSAFNDYRPSTYIDSLGRMNIGGGNITGSNKFQVNCGNNVSVTASGTDSLVEFDSENSAVVDLKIKLASNDICPPGLTFVKTRGTLDQSSCTQQGDILGAIKFRGRAGTFGRLLSEIGSQFTGSGTTRCGDIYFNTANGSDPVERVRISHDGNTGFGVINPTALIHLCAGTVSNAPLKFSSGSLLSIPQAGAMEFCNDKWYGTTTGGTRQCFAFMCDAATITLQGVTTNGASTNIQSCFTNGIRTNKIAPTGDTVTALQINNSTGGTIINVNTLSGFTGFGTVAPQSLIHLYGIDNTPGDGWNYQTNGIRLDGTADTDKDVQWFSEGEPKFTAQIYRGENGKFWYLSSPQSELNQLTVSETGRVGINNQTNIMTYHAVLLVGGPNDMVVGGLYSQNYTSVYEIEIDSITGATDTFRWRVSTNQGNSFSAWSSSSGCTTGATEIQYGVTVLFENVTGHTLGTTIQFGAFAQLPIGTFVVTPNKFSEVVQTLDYTASAITYSDVTAEANSSTFGSYIKIFDTGTTTNAIYFGTLDKLNSIYINLIINGVGVNLIPEYFDGATWLSIGSSFVDSTSNLTTIGGVSWSTPDLIGWIPAYIPDLIEDGYQLYWVRLRTNTAPTVAPYANSFARGGNYRIAVLSSPYDYKPSFYVDSLGRTNIGGGNITGNNVLQVNTEKNVPVSAGDADSLVELDSNDASRIDIKLKLASNDACSPGLIIGKTRGTISAGLNVQNNDEIGHICFKTRVNSVGVDLNTITSVYYGDGNTCYGDLIFFTANGNAPIEKQRISGVGVGFGGITPSAQIHIASGTTTVAPLKFNSGSLLSSPQAGAVEYQGNKYYGTTTGNTRCTFAFLEAPQFTGNVNLPSTTCLNSVNLCNFILNSGGTNNACKLNTSTFQTYTATTAPAQFANKSAVNYYTGTTAPNTYLSISNFNTFSGTTLPNNYYNKSQINLYTGTTAPNQFANKSAVNYYTGTTAPNTYLSKSAFNTYSGTTVPNNYYNKTQINAYTASTQPILSCAITGATNGLYKSGRNLGLGGNLCQNTVITGDTYDFTLSSKRLDLFGANGIYVCDKGAQGIHLYSDGCHIDIEGRTSGGVEKTKLLLSETLATFTDSRAIPVGMEYFADYSANFTCRSFADVEYVNSVASGLNVKAAVNVATTTSITLSGLSTVDGIALANGNRVLVKNQVSGSTNGIYVATGTTWQRASDYNFNPSGEISNGDLIPVNSGNTNRNTVWVLTTADPIVSGDTLSFSLFSQSTGVVAGNGICVTQSGGNYCVAVKLPANSSLCADGTGLYLNSTIAGTGLCYGTGVLCVDGSGLAGNSICWSANTFNVSTTTGTLNTALNSKLNSNCFTLYTGTTAPATYKTIALVNYYTGTTAPATYKTIALVNYYTGTTAPATYKTIALVNYYTGTTAPATYLSISNFNAYSGTTVPNNYYNKTQINTFTGTTLPNNYYNKTQINLYTGTTAPATYKTIALVNYYTGTTAPNTYLTKIAFSAYTGTTLPSNYYNKTCINAYTGATQSAINLKANINSPTFTGIPLAPSAATNTCTSQIATTAFVLRQAGTANPTMNGSVLVGTSFLYSRQDHVHPSDTSRVALTAYQTYTGTTAPATFANKTAVNYYTGTTAPNTYLTISSFNTYTGTTVPNNYYTKTCINTYTGATQTKLNAKAFLSGATFTGVVNVCKPAQNDNTNCAATTSWYISQGATAFPLMDNIACACGTSNLFARQDHVHPSDTSRVIKAGDTMTGALVINSNLTVTGTTILRGATCLGTPASASTVSDRTLFWNPTTCRVGAIQLTGGSDVYLYVDKSTATSTASATCIPYLSGTPWNFGAGRYQVDFTAQVSNSANGGVTLVKFGCNGTVIGNNFCFQGLTAGYRMDASMTRDITFTAGCHCLAIHFWAGANTACIFNGVIRAKRIC